MSNTTVVLLGVAVLAAHVVNVTDNYRISRLEEQIRNPETITLGRGDCAVSVNVDVWDELNQIGVYLWAAACENMENANGQ